MYMTNALQRVRELRVFLFERGLRVLLVDMYMTNALQRLRGLRMLLFERGLRVSG